MLDAIAIYHPQKRHAAFHPLAAAAPLAANVIKGCPVFRFTPRAASGRAGAPSCSAGGNGPSTFNTNTAFAARSVRASRRAVGGRHELYAPGGQRGCREPGDETLER
jgi:hypothetical protein